MSDKRLLCSAIVVVALSAPFLFLSGRWHRSHTPRHEVLSPQKPIPSFDIFLEEVIPHVAEAESKQSETVVSGRTIDAAHLRLKMLRADVTLNDQGRIAYLFLWQINKYGMEALELSISTEELEDIQRLADEWAVETLGVVRQPDGTIDPAEVEQKFMERYVIAPTMRAVKKK